jgi:NCAIR mutase (PurE)-related protein
MRDVLEAVAAGELSPEAAEAKLSGYATSEAGRYDAARETRSGVPEAVYAEMKTPEEVATLVATSVETTGRAIATRCDDDQIRATRERVEESVPDASIRLNDRAGVLVVHGADFEPPEIAASVCIVTAGTSDAVPAGEATAIVREMGADVERISDVGVAALARLTDRLDDLRAHDVLIVAAGREGALPTVTAGLVDVPVIGLPVSTGYGHAGEGEAALSGMLQSCTALSVVNIDAGFTAGVQAGLIARQIGSAREE